MVQASSNLVAIRQALVDMVAPHLPGLGAGLILYEGETMDPRLPASTVAARVRFVLPRRSLIGFEGEPLVLQAGGFVVEWLIPAGVGWSDMTDRVEATVALLRERTLPGGVRIHGDAQTTRKGIENGRLVLAVRCDWQTEFHERNAGDTTRETALVDPKDALLAVRQVWASRIEQPSSGWDGLATRWDWLPDLATPPMLPWCGYWIDLIDTAARETQGATQSVVGRALVQLHTSPRGLVPTLLILERIIAEHNRFARSVSIGPVDLEAHFLGPAATLQTNLRIPFRFERART